MIQKTGLKNAPEYLGDQRCFFESGNYPFGYAIILVNQRRFVNPILFFRQHFPPPAYCEDIVLPPPPWASAYSAAPAFRHLLWRLLPALPPIYRTASWSPDYGTHAFHNSRSVRLSHPEAPPYTHPCSASHCGMCIPDCCP